MDNLTIAFNKEIWKQIKNFSDYEISNCGQIKRIIISKRNNYPPGKILKCNKKTNGYIQIGLFKDRKKYYRLIHRLVLETFNPIENTENLEVNHINGIKSDNRLENLEWCTHSENQKHAYKIKLREGYSSHISRNIGEKHGMSKLTKNDIEEIRQYLDKGLLNQKKIAKKFKVSPSLISMIKLGKIWNNENNI